MQNLTKLIKILQNPNEHNLELPDEFISVIKLGLKDVSSLIQQNKELADTNTKTRTILYKICQDVVDGKANLEEVGLILKKLE